MENVETVTVDPGAGNHTGKVVVEMTPSNWIDYRAQFYKSIGGVVSETVDGRTKAILDFLDTFFKCK